MHAKEIRDLEDAELAKRVTELRRDLLGLRFSNATGELEDTSSLGRTKRELARVLTIARERELAARAQRRGPRPERGARRGAWRTRQTTRLPTTATEQAPEAQAGGEQA